MEIREALGRLFERQDLTQEEMIQIMRQVMTGAATDAQIGALLASLRMKSESIDEITGAAMVMRELAARVDLGGADLVDLCGTGGDGANLFNVSTAASFVAAAAGVRVAKHGNRSVSSSTGSADVLEAAGVQLDLTPDQVARCIQEIHLGFMFAPGHHAAMKHAINPRREIGQRTIFNILGPLTNPAGAKRQVLGVFNQALCKPLAEVLMRLGSEHVLVVHADDGLDEISLASSTTVAELKDGQIQVYRIQPEDFGIESQSLVGLAVSSAAESLELIRGALGKTNDPRFRKAADIIALNAGAAIYVSGVASSMKEGVLMAEDAIGSGLAREKLSELVDFTKLLKATSSP